MTSFIINAHVNRPISEKFVPKDRCVFCKIISGKAPAYKIYETEQVIAILDIQPLRKGHVLVIPKDHHSYVSELPEEVAGALGKAVSKVAKAISQALENSALNVVCNQIYAQAVPHVHYHIIPAPRIELSSENTQTSEIYPDNAMSYMDMHRSDLFRQSIYMIHTAF
ncbi:HIT [Pyrrhoderma noxium]|uniref:HIT n=1 Tax=Pyrrhoderma noxium TaxID=2282107 RepID=A0A286UCK4_9AGAM|nr:HIT [Pyrrhoderma noxium]